MAEFKQTYKKVNFVNGRFAESYLRNFVDGKMADLAYRMNAVRCSPDDIMRYNDMQAEVEALGAKAFNVRSSRHDEGGLQRVNDEIYRLVAYSLLPLLQKYEEAPASSASPVDDAPLVLEGERAIETDEEPEGYGEVDDSEPGAAYAPGVERVGETESE
jgi:hypothetical protein